jgi:hypothetical protein
MKNIVRLSCAAALITASLSAEESLENAFKAGKASGNIRLASIYHSPDQSGANNTYATAIGGIVKYETAAYSNVKLGLAGYLSQNISLLSGSKSSGKFNGDFADDELHSFAYVGEAYVNYSENDLSVTVGRQVIDNPYVNADDIRMNQNTFEAAVITYEGMEKTEITAGYATRWAGIDSQGDISSFKKIGPENSNGLLMVGAVTEHVENMAIQGWFYDLNKHSRIVYGDASYTLQTESGAEFNAGIQIAKQDEKNGSGVGALLYGAMIEASHMGLTLGAAYDELDVESGKSYYGGPGGGVAYVNMEETTVGVAEISQDVDAWKAMIGYDIGYAGIEGLGVEYHYGHFKGSARNKIIEQNLIVTYEAGETMDFELIYTDANDKYNNIDGGNDAGFDQLLARANYHF